jgi:hypothetical protein
MRPLFEGRESLVGTVITADAMHAQRDHADFIVDERGGDYPLGVKSNLSYVSVSNYGQRARIQIPVESTRRRQDNLVDKRVDRNFGER